MIDNIKSVLEHLKKEKPLILCMTNYVTMDFMANSLLALGAAPIMSCEEKEFEELVKLSRAVNLNIGTLDDAFVKKCKVVADIAQAFKKPIVLDPVGAGASVIRTTTARELMHFSTVIRGNASEMSALAHENQKTLGVESTMAVEGVQGVIHRLAQRLQSTLVVSGQQDFITDGNRKKSLPYGSSLMPFVTGMGCTLTAVITAFCAVVPDKFEAASLATAYFGLCGNLAAEQTSGVGTFRSTFIDALGYGDLEKMRKFYAK